MVGVAPVVVDGDGLVGVGHHGDEHVEQHDDQAAAVDPEHQQRPEPRELLDTCTRLAIRAVNEPSRSFSDRRWEKAPTRAFSLFR